MSRRRRHPRRRAEPRNVHVRIAQALCAAESAARASDVAAAERWARFADRLAVLSQRMQRMPPPEPDEDIDELRAELRRRFERIVGFSLETQEWVRKPDELADLSPVEDDATSP